MLSQIATETTDTRRLLHGSMEAKAHVVLVFRPELGLKFRLGNVRFSNWISNSPINEKV